MRTNYSEINSLSSGIVNSVIKLIEIIKDNGGGISNDEFNVLSPILFAPIENVKEFASFLDCFIIIDEVVSINSEFEYLDNQIEIYRQINLSFLIKVKPIWIDRLKWGLQSVSESMDENTRHCFKESGLLDFNDIAVLKWWYSLPYFKGDEKNMITGAIGELLTVYFEENVKGRKAERDSLKSSSKGYDVSSIDQFGRNFIEAKTSENGSFIFITRNEWEKSKILNPYYFYIWILKEHKADLYIFSTFQLVNHVPEKSRSGFGQFETCMIDVKKLLNCRTKSFECNFKFNLKNKLVIY
jgi:hypothetical protein